MRRIGRVTTAALLLAAGLTAASASFTFANSRHERTIIDADVLVPVTAPYTGETNAIRGVVGGGLPWVIADGELRLRTDGSVKADIEGLVVDPNVDNKAIAGTNPVASWKIIVSCLSTSAGQATTVNVSSAPFPADADGDAKVRTSVALPHPCIAPVVFVASAGGAWFAATGA